MPAEPGLGSNVEGRPRTTEREVGRSHRGISVVVPLRDEAPNVEPLVESLTRQLKGRKLEIILVNDHSRDETASAILRCARRWPAHVRSITLSRRSGKQNALLAGFAQAAQPLILTLDGDLQDDPGYLGALEAAMISTGADGVLAARVARSEPVIKRLPSQVFNYLVRRRFGLRLRDINTPFRLFDRRLVDGLHLREGEFRFLPVIWTQQGYKLVEVPVEQRPRAAGRSKYRGFRRCVEALRTMYAIPVNRRDSQTR